MSEVEMDDIRDDYLESLQELTFNSAPIIKSLTVIAQENIDYAPAIVKALEQHLAKCPPTHKLPALYLLDSICKNIGPPYTTYFGMNLFKLYTDVYTSVGEPVRKKMFDLFRTWKVPNVPHSHGGPLFARDPMERIETFLTKARLKQVEYPPVGPISSGPMGPGHIGPGPGPAMPMPFGNMPPQALGMSALLTEVDRLIDLTNQRKLLDPGDSDAAKQLDILSQLRMIIPTLTPDNFPAIQSQLVTFRQKEVEILNKKLLQKPQKPVHKDKVDLSKILNQNHNKNSSGAGQKPLSGLSMSLINSLQSAGLLNKGVVAAIDVQLDSASLHKPRPELIDTLYKSMPNQCSTCGKRFKDDAKGKTQREAHLDWHFRVNKRLRDQTRTQNRTWFLSVGDWVEFKDEDGILGNSVAAASANGVTDDVYNDQSSAEANELAASVNLEELQKKFVPIPADKSLVCPICQEKFDSVWSDDAEAWVWMNAVNAQGKIYHATCHNDMKKSLAKNSGGNSGGAGGGAGAKKARASTPLSNAESINKTKAMIANLAPGGLDLAAILANSAKRSLEDAKDDKVVKKEKTEKV